jgi:hypothetical protein
MDVYEPQLRNRAGPARCPPDMHNYPLQASSYRNHPIYALRCCSVIAVVRRGELLLQWIGLHIQLRLVTMIRAYDAHEPNLKHFLISE